MIDQSGDHCELMILARKVRQRMRETEAALGLLFPLHVRFMTALEVIETGLAMAEWLEVAVGYLMLREIVDEVRSEQASRN